MKNKLHKIVLFDIFLNNILDTGESVPYGKTETGNRKSPGVY
jgi:hypothetical protein